MDKGPSRSSIEFSCLRRLETQPTTCPKALGIVFQDSDEVRQRNLSWGYADYYHERHVAIETSRSCQRMEGP